MSLTRAQRLFLGIFILIIVDVIWVASSELTEYIFNDTKFSKPFFSTYLKCSMFIVYLGGFLIQRSWWHQCRKNNHLAQVEPKTEADNLLSDPIFVPIKYEDKSGTESDDSSHDLSRSSSSVRFSNLSEVRQLSEAHAEDALLARLSYSAFLRAEESRLRVANKLNVKQVAKLAFVFCIIFFLGNLSYQESLKNSQAGLVSVLSSTSSLFTVVLSAIFPSGGSDRFTLTKFVSVLLSIGGIVMVCFANKQFEYEIPLGALWALSGALFYAIYVVLIRKRVENEDKLNMPMFFGFAGLFIMILMWPGFFIVHYSHAETFVWPNKIQWLFLVINGLVGTVISKLLWLWGCFMTSSLIATLSLSLIIPMTMTADIIINDVQYGWMFYVGSIPVFLSFFTITLLTHYESWDPLLLVLKKKKVPTATLR